MYYVAGGFRSGWCGNQYVVGCRGAPVTFRQAGGSGTADLRVTGNLAVMGEWNDSQSELYHFSFSVLAKITASMLHSGSEGTKDHV
jgi:hypothetical protein